MTHSVREVVAVFDDVKALERAVTDLEAKGFGRSAISLLASEEAVKQKLGERYQRVEQMEDNPKAPRETFLTWISQLDPGFGLKPALAFVGTLVAMGSHAIVLPILIGTGGGTLIGAALRRLLRHHQAELLDEQIQRGGLLLWVNVRDRKEEKEALSLLKAHDAHHVHAHSLSI